MSIHTERGDFTLEATWGALKKCWTGYKIAIDQRDRKRQEEYAIKIRALQRQLGKDQSKFPHLGLI